MLILPAPPAPQTAAAAHEVVPVVPPADPPQRAHLPAVQGQEPLAQPQEAQEEVVTDTQVTTASYSSGFIFNCVVPIGKSEATSSGRRLLTSKAGLGSLRFLACL